MSIISLFPIDHSDLLCKRYASAVTGYFDNPAAAKDPVAQVPLENVFRVLEMYRYDAFADEHRKGVLALETHDGEGFDPSFAGAWHTHIKEALDKAASEVFGASSSKDTVVPRLQESLRSLVRGQTATFAALNVGRSFFQKFSETLAGPAT